MKFLYSVDSESSQVLKIRDSNKWGDATLDQTFFPWILDKDLGPQEHIYLVTGEISSYLRGFVTEEHGRDIYKKIETDVDGLIIPINHGDMNEVIHIAKGLGRPYSDRVSEDIKMAWEEVNISRRGAPETYENHPLYRSYLKKAVEGSKGTFFNSFDFPIFEAHQHFPGYRETPAGLGMVSKREDKNLEKHLEYVEAAFGVWVKHNFKDKE